MIPTYATAAVSLGTASQSGGGKSRSEVFNFIWMYKQQSIGGREQNQSSFE